MDFDMNMLAYCGLYCELCSGRVGYAERNFKHMEHLPAKYTKGRPNLSDYNCEGCKGHNICGPCPIKDCASARTLDSCAECGDFPCAALDGFGNDGAPHHRQAIENLRAIRRDGIETWFAALKPALRCHCGERQSWYYTCPLHRQHSPDGTP